VAQQHADDEAKDEQNEVIHFVVIPAQAGSQKIYKFREAGRIQTAY
jgi:hypothetical protein